MFDGDTLKFQERLEITYPGATEVDMRLQQIQRPAYASPALAQDILLVVGYHGTGIGVGEMLWSKLSDPNYAL